MGDADEDHAEADNANGDADGFRPDPGWGPLTFRGTCLAFVLMALGVLGAVVVGYVLLGTGAFVPGPGAYDWGVNAQPDYIKWYVFVLPAAAVFALIVIFYALVQVVLLRDEEPFTRRYVFDFRVERAERGMIHVVLLGVLSALVPRR